MLKKKHPDHIIESIKEHFEYIKNLVGIDHVVFAPDTLYGGNIALHYVFSAVFSLNQITDKTSFVEVPYVKRLENPTEAS